MMKLLAFFILVACSTNAFRLPTPLPASSDEFCASHYARAFAKIPKSRALNKNKYTYQALNEGLSARANKCYQDYIETNLDRHQGRVACVSFIINQDGINQIEFADVGVFNPPQPIKDCTIAYLKSAKSNVKGQDSVFVEQTMVFFTRASP
jgi:hypothetical protein